MQGNLTPTAVSSDHVDAAMHLNEKTVDRNPSPPPHSSPLLSSSSFPLLICVIPALIEFFHLQLLNLLLGLENVVGVDETPGKAALRPYNHSHSCILNLVVPSLGC